MTKQCNVLLLLLFSAVVAGCASSGPGTVSRDRFDYNASITESWKRQILLNIVKLRYAEPVAFVDVGQIVAGYSLESGVSLGASALSNFYTAAKVEAGISGKYTDRPTITYVPLTGNAFIKSLMTPFSPENMLFAIQSGVPADMIFKLGVASINGLRNRSAPIAGFRPADHKFQRVYELMRSLQISGAINMKSIRGKDNKEITTISFWSKGAPPEITLQLTELYDLLGLDHGADHYRLVHGSITSENNREIAMQSFPLMHLLSFLAAQVEIPEQHIIDGRASKGSSEVSESKSSKERFVVKCSDSKPGDAFISVEYRNHWFWIDDRDMESKRAISFVMLVFTLVDSGRQELLPQVTIPAQ